MSTFDKNRKIKNRNKKIENKNRKKKKKYVCGILFIPMYNIFIFIFK